MLTKPFCFVMTALCVACSGSAPMEDRFDDTGAPHQPARPNPAQPKQEGARTQLASEALPALPSGVNLLGGIAASSSAVGELDVFAVSDSGVLWHVRFADGAWQVWEALSERGRSDTGVAAVANGAQGLDLFYRDAASQRLGHSYLDSGGAWQTELLGKSTIPKHTPSAASSAAGSMDVFARGPGSTLLRLSKARSWAEDWLAVAGVKNVGSAPSASAWGPSRLDVFWSETNSQLLGHWSSDGGVEKIEELSGGDALAGPPAVASRGSGLLDVLYVSNTRESTLVRRFLDESWGDEGFALPGASSIASVSWGPGRLDTFYLDQQGAVRHAIIPGPAMLTQHNDIARTGGSTHEVELNVTNVASDRFGKLFTIPVDGNVWAQPLYQPTVDLSDQGQGIRNVLYVATGNDSVYLFDADDGQPLAQRSLGHPVPVPFADFTTGSGHPGDTCHFNSLPQIGITSTPVLDPVSNTLYVVATTADEQLAAEPIGQCAAVQDPTHVYRVQLHALDSRTLAERPGSPVTVDPNYEYDDQVIPFLANRQLQRPGLLLSQGRVYLAFGSYTDRRPYYGWVISYDAKTLAQVGVWVSAPEGVNTQYSGLTAIWQSGQGLAADADGNVYFLTGNGQNGSQFPYTNAAVELSSDLSVVSYFRPFNGDALNNGDLDLSSSGAMLIPETNFVIGGGKEGRVYVMNRGDLGGFSVDANDVAFEDLTAIPDDDCEEENEGISNLHSSVIYWKSSSGAANLYLMGEADHLKKLELNETSGEFSVVAQSEERAPCGMPGGFLSVSSNGSDPKTAVVWANVPTLDAVDAVVPANFYAFDAETLETLYHDESRALPTSLEKFAKNVAPTVANGRVYQAAFGPADDALGSLNDTYSGSVVVYGLKSK